MDVLCDVCGILFSSDLEFMTHWENEHNRCGSTVNTNSSQCLHSRCGGNDIKMCGCTDSKGQHVTCYLCGNAFTKRKNLYKHLRKIHEVEPSISSRLSVKHCPLCGAGCCTYSEIDDHLYSCHGIAQQVEEISFDSLLDFYTWKENEEAYIPAHYSGKSKNSKKTYFICHQSGAGGSEKLPWKIRKTCPARIVLTEVGETCQVQYFKVHAGHEDAMADNLMIVKRKRSSKNRHEKLENVINNILVVARNLPPQVLTQLVTLSEQFLQLVQNILSIQNGESLQNTKRNFIAVVDSLERDIGCKHGDIENVENTSFDNIETHMFDFNELNELCRDASILDIDIATDEWHDQIADNDLFTSTIDNITHYK